MFALIETKGATHIAINIAKEGSDKSLPALVSMLEQNTTFIKKAWKELSLLKPEMTIILGNTYHIEDPDCCDIVINTEPHTIDESFVIATPEIFTSNMKTLAKKDEENKRLSTELSHLKNKLASVTEELDTAKKELSIATEELAMATAMENFCTTESKNIKKM